MRRLSLLIACVLWSCSGGFSPGHYAYNDAQLGTIYRAKEMCSCLFVMQQTQAYCTAWTVASPDVVTFTVDLAAKSVETQALLEWGGRAHYVNAREGCIAE